MNKRGQQTFSISFGMIFSIILIIVFFVVAIIAIKFFLNLGDVVGVEQFYEDLQNKIDNVWRSQSTDTIFEIDLPQGIEKVCFGNLSNDITNQRDFKEIEIYKFSNKNVFLIPPEKAGDSPTKLINHIDIKNIIKIYNPYCVNAKGELKIKKDFYDKLVLIE